METTTPAVRRDNGELLVLQQQCQQRPADQTLTPREMDIIKSLDSRSFGFLDLATPSSSSKESLSCSSESTTPSSATSSSSSTISFMSVSFLKKGINMLRIELLSDLTSKAVRSKMLCHVAHLHLLLKEYTEALSAYQHCCLLDPHISNDTTFLYGVGLIYFALAKYDWALEAFAKVLLLAPDFARLNEVHVRMGLMLKKEGNLSDALKHFMAALNHSGPCCITKLEMHFHVGHIHHISGDYVKAKHSFEWILASKNVPNDIKALTLRQLGWLYHTVPHIATRGENPHSKAIELLKLAVSANPDSGQAWYFLGRCHADQGQYREAFQAYRQSVMKVEEHADTWCAIGILYQQMGQARDSLQAYITAVFFTPTHVETWTDLGLLYESCDQLIDGFLCYKNGLNAMEKKTRLNKKGVGFDGVHEILSTRVRFVEHQIQQSGGLAYHTQQNSLPTLFEAWHSLVPQHLREKYTPSEIPILQLSPVPSFNGIMSPGITRSMKHKKIRPSKDPIILKSMSDGWNAISSPGKLVSDINQDNSVFDHHLMPMLPPDFLPNQTDVPMASAYYSNNSNMQPAGPNDGTANGGILSPTLCSPTQTAMLANHSPMGRATTAGDVNMVAPSELSSNLSAISTQFGERIQDPGSSFQPNSILNQSVPSFGNYNHGIIGNNALMQSTGSFEDRSPLPKDLSTVHPLQLEAQNVNMADYLGTLVSNPNEIHIATDSGDLEVRDSITRMPSVERESETVLGKRSRDQLQQQISSAASSKLIANSPGPLHSPSLKGDSLQSNNKSPRITSHHHLPSTTNGNQSDTSSGVSSHKMSISDSPISSPSPLSTLIMCDTGKVEREDFIPIPEPFPGLGDPREYMSTEPFRPPSPTMDTPIDMDLTPDVPVIEVLSREHALSEELHAFCTNPDRPICIIKGLADAVSFDMNLFKTKTLMRQCGEHDVEIREQNLQAADENWDPTGKKQVWKCESSRSLTTVQEYGQYQLGIIEEEMNNINSSQSRKILKFGTNCDLSDKHKWRKQLTEIKKLPKFVQVECPEANLLNHVGHTILGMNSVQLYMKVPGCRTPGHQENNNFCSVNINIGPGNCEWFAVHNKYWGVVNKLCEKNKLCFLTGSWWPILEELREMNVPLYRFTQYEGETVWINPGTVHWVQANSSCNNIAWNVGSLTAHQLRMAWERYQWNKFKKVRSIVPMITLTWNLAKRMNLTDPHTRQQISSYLCSSYKQCEQLLDQLHNADIPVIWHGRVEGELTPTCTMCMEEVFNILFVSTNKKGDHLVHCHKCVQQVQSKNKKATFTVLQQYTLTELQKTLSKYLPASPNNTRHSSPVS